MRIAVDEISAFLLSHEMDIYLVVFDDKAKSLGERLFPALEEYIDQNYVEDKRDDEYGKGFWGKSGSDNVPMYTNEYMVERRRRRAEEGQSGELGAYLSGASVGIKLPGIGSIFRKNRKEAEKNRKRHHYVMKMRIYIQILMMFTKTSLQNVSSMHRIHSHNICCI